MEVCVSDFDQFWICCSLGQNKKYIFFICAFVKLMHPASLPGRTAELSAAWRKVPDKSEGSLCFFLNKYPNGRCTVIIVRSPLWPATETPAAKPNH